MVCLCATLASCTLRTIQNTRQHAFAGGLPGNLYQRVFVQRGGRGRCLPVAVVDGVEKQEVDCDLSQQQLFTKRCLFQADVIERWPVESMIASDWFETWLERQVSALCSNQR